MKLQEMCIENLKTKFIVTHSACDKNKMRLVFGNLWNTGGLLRCNTNNSAERD
jgi:hypothetical protein